jgi:hypothetical protein
MKRICFLFFCFVLLSGAAQPLLQEVQATRQYYVSGHPAGGSGYNFEVSGKVQADSVSIRQLLLNGQSVEFISPKAYWMKGDSLFIKLTIRLLQENKAALSHPSILICAQNPHRKGCFRIRRFRGKERFTGY